MLLLKLLSYRQAIKQGYLQLYELAVRRNGNIVGYK